MRSSPMEFDPDLLGGWTIVRAIDSGRSESDFEDGCYWFEKDRVVLGDLSSFAECRYRADASIIPHQSDIWGGEDDPFHQSGIYVLAGSELTICCVDGDQQERPTSFESTDDNGWVRYQLRPMNISPPA